MSDTPFDKELRELTETAMPHDNAPMSDEIDFTDILEPGPPEAMSNLCGSCGHPAIYHYKGGCEVVQLKLNTSPCHCTGFTEKSRLEASAMEAAVEQHEAIMDRFDPVFRALASRQPEDGGKEG